MVKVIDQDIPAEMTDEYDASLHRAAVWIPGSAIRQVRRRVPFRIPHLQDPPIGNPSRGQRIQRGYFKKCVACFNVQPDSGGATPPDIGPRDRPWWYDESLGEGLFYYDYFMQQSLDLYVAGTLPDWCKQIVFSEKWTAATPGQYNNTDVFVADEGNYLVSLYNEAGTYAGYITITGDNKAEIYGEVTYVPGNSVVRVRLSLTSLKDITIDSYTQISFTGSSNITLPGGATYYGEFWVYFKKGFQTKWIEYRFNSTVGKGSADFLFNDVANVGKRNLWNDFYTVHGFYPEEYNFSQIFFTTYCSIAAAGSGYIKITADDIIMTKEVET